MKQVLLLWIAILALALVLASCASVPTPTAVPTQVPPTTAPTAVPPTSAPATTAPTTAPTTAATTAATAASTSPTKAAAATGDSAALAPTKATPTLPTGTLKSADDMLEVTAQQLKALMDGGADIIIVDGQPAEAFVLGHITGAVNVPWDMKIKAPSNLDKNKLLVIYCGCSPDAKPSATDAGDIAMQLYSNYGYRKMATLKGGWDHWKELGYPTVKGN